MIIIIEVYFKQINMDFQNYLLQEINKYKIISIIGIAKNVSKTTTLNHIIKILSDNYTIGVTSIGRDGEKFDIITKEPKPRILVKTGTFVATAKQCYCESNLSMEIIISTGYNTPLGEIIILKALDDGYIELAGPSMNKQLSVICSELLKHGCNFVLIDGAFDRKSSATPIISDATILSTGASVFYNMREVVNLTTHVVEMLTLEREKDNQIISLAKEILKESKIGIINMSKSIKILNLVTALGTVNEILNALDDYSEYIVIGGAVSDQFLENLCNFKGKPKKIILLVKDATKLFINSNSFKRFQKEGGLIKVIKPIKLLALTVNPTSPFGYKFDKNEFLFLLKNNIKIPIYDLGPND